MAVAVLAKSSAMYRLIYALMGRCSVAGTDIAHGGGASSIQHDCQVEHYMGRHQEFPQRNEARWG